MSLCEECPWSVAIICVSLGGEQMYLQRGGVIGTPPPPETPNTYFSKVAGVVE